MLLLLQLNNENVLHAAKPLQREVENSEISWEGESVRYTVSMGVPSRANPQDKESAS